MSGYAARIRSSRRCLAPVSWTTATRTPSSVARATSGSRARSSGPSLLPQHASRPPAARLEPVEQRRPRPSRRRGRRGRRGRPRPTRLAGRSFARSGRWVSAMTRTRVPPLLMAPPCHAATPADGVEGQRGTGRPGGAVGRVEVDDLAGALAAGGDLLDEHEGLELQAVLLGEQAGDPVDLGRVGGGGGPRLDGHGALGDRPRRLHSATVTRGVCRTRLSFPVPAGVKTARRSPSGTTHTGVGTASPVRRKVVSEMKSLSPRARSAECRHGANLRRHPAATVREDADRPSLSRPVGPPTLERVGGQARRASRRASRKRRSAGVWVRSTARVVGGDRLLAAAQPREQLGAGRPRRLEARARPSSSGAPRRRAGPARPRHPRPRRSRRPGPSRCPRLGRDAVQRAVQVEQGRPSRCVRSWRARSARPARPPRAGSARATPAGWAARRCSCARAMQGGVPPRRGPARRAGTNDPSAAVRAARRAADSPTRAASPRASGSSGTSSASTSARCSASGGRSRSPGPVDQSMT